MHLDKSEVFVALIFEDLGEESNVVLLLDVSLDSVDDGSSPLDDQGLESIFLVEISVHELLECLLAHLVLHALLVELHLLRVHVLNRVLQLLQSQNTVLSFADWS